MYLTWWVVYLKMLLLRCGDLCRIALDVRRARVVPLRLGSRWWRGCRRRRGGHEGVGGGTALLHATFGTGTTRRRHGENRETPASTKYCPPGSKASRPEDLEILLNFLTYTYLHQPSTCLQLQCSMVVFSWWRKTAMSSCLDIPTNKLIKHITFYHSWFCIM